MDVETFRQDFPEFQDAATYPDPLVTFFLNLAEQLLPQCRWGTIWPYGVELFIAHNLAIAARDQATATAGGAPGEMKGPVTAKAVDKVSVSYDAAAISLTDAGFWNMTSYGTRLMFYANMFGAGGVQL